MWKLKDKFFAARSQCWAIHATRSTK